MLTSASILDVLREIPDPEMPISIVDLGLIDRVDVERDGSVQIRLLPTFVGCPALDMIATQVRRRVGAMQGVGGVQVKWVFDPPWNVDRISETGRASLKQHGVSVPERCDHVAVGESHGRDGCVTNREACATNGAARHEDAPARSGAAAVALRTSALACPFCGSTSTRLDSPFGPTRCRSIYYCEACRNSFEQMKRV